MQLLIIVRFHEISTFHELLNFHILLRFRTNNHSYGQCVNRLLTLQDAPKIRESLPARIPLSSSTRDLLVFLELVSSHAKKEPFSWVILPSDVASHSQFTCYETILKRQLEITASAGLRGIEGTVEPMPVHQLWIHRTGSTTGENQTEDTGTLTNRTCGQAQTLSRNAYIQANIFTVASVWPRAQSFLYAAVSHIDPLAGPHGFVSKIIKNRFPLYLGGQGTLRNTWSNRNMGINRGE